MSSMFPDGASTASEESTNPFQKPSYPPVLHTYSTGGSRYKAALSAKYRSDLRARRVAEGRDPSLSTASSVASASSPLDSTSASSPLESGPLETECKPVLLIMLSERYSFCHIRF